MLTLPATLKNTSKLREDGNDHLKICFIQDSSYGFEFSGISGSGKRKFGLGFYNPVESVKKPDELLSWQIPKQWSYEDASSVPLFYLQVSLFGKRNILIQLSEYHVIKCHSTIEFEFFH